MKKFQDYFQVRSKVRMGVQIKIEIHVVVRFDNKKMCQFKKVCESKEEALELISAYENFVMRESFLAGLAANFLCDSLEIDKNGKTINEAVTEIKAVMKKRMEEAEHE